MRADPFFGQSSLSSLNQVQLTEQKLTQELSSGVRVNSLSDDPLAAAQDSSIRGQISQNVTFTQSAATTAGQLQLVDQVLGSVVTQLTRAVSVSVAGSNGTLTNANRASISAELVGIRDEVLSLANTSYGGSALFAGSRTNAQTFTLDQTTTPATAVYQGDSDVVSITTPGGASIPTSIPGDRIFSGAGANVLGVLNQLISDFGSASGAAGTVADTSALNASLSSVSSLRASFDSSINRLQSAVTYSQNEQIQLQAQEDALIQADPASVATDLKNAEVQQNALFSVLASVNRSNLFDYLK